MRGEKGAGWIRIDRDIRNHWIYSDKPFNRFQAWIDLIMQAGYQDNKIIINGNPVVLKRGSFLTSTRKLADRWGWSRNKVIRFLNVLRIDGMIRTDTNGGTILTIVKYSVYQSSRTTNGTTNGATDGTTDGANNGTQRRSTKKDKKEKKKIDETFSSDTDEEDDEGEDPAETRRKWLEANKA